MRYLVYFPLPTYLQCVDELQPLSLQMTHSDSTTVVSYESKFISYLVITSFLRKRNQLPKSYKTDRWKHIELAHRRLYLSPRHCRGSLPVFCLVHHMNCKYWIVDQQTCTCVNTVVVKVLVASPGKNPSGLRSVNHVADPCLTIQGSK